MGELVNSSYTALHTSRGIQHINHKLFMRWSVIAADILGTNIKCCGAAPLLTASARGFSILTWAVAPTLVSIFYLREEGRIFFRRH